jgi:hypothetical protein
MRRFGGGEPSMPGAETLDVVLDIAETMNGEVYGAREGRPVADGSLWTAVPVPLDVPKNQKAIGRLRRFSEPRGFGRPAQLLNRRFGRSRCAAATGRIRRRVRGALWERRACPGGPWTYACGSAATNWRGREAEGIVKRASTPALGRKRVERAA